VRDWGARGGERSGGENWYEEGEGGESGNGGGEERRGEGRRGREGRV